MPGIELYSARRHRARRNGGRLPTTADEQVRQLAEQVGRSIGHLLRRIDRPARPRRG